MLTYID